MFQVRVSGEPDSIIMTVKRNARTPDCDCIVDEPALGRYRHRVPHHHDYRA